MWEVEFLSTIHFIHELVRFSPSLFAEFGLSITGQNPLSAGPNAKVLLDYLKSNQSILFPPEIL